MNQPLGLAIGNNLEVIEAINTLNGNGPKDLVELCINAGAIMLTQAKRVNNVDEGKKLLEENIKNGKALDKLAQMVKAQGGDESYIYNPSKFDKAKYIIDVKSNKAGYVKEINALEIGEAVMKLGAGRATKEDVLDFTAGIVLEKKVGSIVDVGDTLCKVYSNKENIDSILNEVLESFKFTYDELKTLPII